MKLIVWDMLYAILLPRSPFCPDPNDSDRDLQEWLDDICTHPHVDVTLIPDAKSSGLGAQIKDDIKNPSNKVNNKELHHPVAHLSLW